jgi:hypothetical protein
MWSIKLLKVQVTCRVVVGYNVQIRVHYYAEWIIIGIKTGGGPQNWDVHTQALTISTISKGFFFTSRHMPILRPTILLVYYNILLCSYYNQWDFLDFLFGMNFHNLENYFFNSRKLLKRWFWRCFFSCHFLKENIKIVIYKPR